MNRWSWLVVLAVAPLVAQSNRPRSTSSTKGGHGRAHLRRMGARPGRHFNMVFGYLNRNHVEEPVIPVGPQKQLRTGFCRSRSADVLLSTREPLHFQSECAEGLGSEEGARLDADREREDRTGARDADGYWEIDRHSRSRTTVAGCRLARADREGSAADGDNRSSGACRRGHAVTLTRERHRRWDSGERETSPAAPARTDAPRQRTAFARQRAAPAAAASTSGRRVVGAVARLSRAGRRVVRS